MLLRKLVVVGLVGFVSFAANIAKAEEAGDYFTVVGVEGANLSDPFAGFSGHLAINVSESAERSFAATNRQDRRDRDYEVELVASAGGGFDVAFAQRAGVGFNPQGDIERESRGSELRFGRVRRDTPNAEPTWYFFAASEDEALTWRPGVRNDFGGQSSSFTVQDRVEIGDIQAGVTYERNGWQASLVYVEREITVRTTGARTVSQDEDFAGFTLTMRH